MEWAEALKDRVMLYESTLIEIMTSVELRTEEITEEDSVKMGVTKLASQELHGLLKDRTQGSANSIVRDNTKGVGIESWRRLCFQYNPKTLRGTMAAQHKELHPKGAKKMSELPKCIADWERDLRRCSQEGRSQPDNETKRLALLRMLPTKQREALWDNADVLYPTFRDLMQKVQKLVQEDVDNHNGVGPMDIDNIDEPDDDDWVSTGQTFAGKGQSGEDVIFVLQRKGNMTRISQKGRGRGRPGGGAPPWKRSAPIKDEGAPGSPTWDKNGCARCGRGGHWAKECHAKTDIFGNPPKEKPPARKTKGRGKGALADLTDEQAEGTAEDANGEVDPNDMCEESDGEIGQMFMLEDDACQCCDPWLQSELDPWFKVGPSGKVQKQALEPIQLSTTIESRPAPIQLSTTIRSDHFDQYYNSTARLPQSENIQNTMPAFPSPAQTSGRSSPLMSESSNSEQWFAHFRSCDCRHCGLAPPTLQQISPLTIKIRDIERQAMNQAIMDEVAKLAANGVGCSESESEIDFEAYDDEDQSTPELDNDMTQIEKVNEMTTPKTMCVDSQGITVYPEPQAQPMPSPVPEVGNLRAVPAEVDRAPPGTPAGEDVGNLRAVPASAPVAQSLHRHPPQPYTGPNDNDSEDEVEPPPGIDQGNSRIARKKNNRFTKSQRRNMRRRERKTKQSPINDNNDANDNDGSNHIDLLGMRVRTRGGREGVVTDYDPNDQLLQFKVVFEDSEMPSADWLHGADVFTINGFDIFTNKPYNPARFPESNSALDRPSASVGPSIMASTHGGRSGHEAGADSIPAVPVGGQGEDRHEGADPKAELDEDDDDDMLCALPTEEGIGDQYGLHEIPGGIGIDSCASDNVMARSMLPGYTVKSSAGSRRGQRWGSASGHGITNEGEVTYRFMTEHGDVASGTTQIGEVKRPLAAVSNITKGKVKKIAFFCEDEDWIIDRRDPVAEEILKLVRRAKLKTKVHEHKGTYRMRAWLMPPKVEKGAKAPFHRQEA